MFYENHHPRHAPSGFVIHVEAKSPPLIKTDSWGNYSGSYPANANRAKISTCSMAYNVPVRLKLIRQMNNDKRQQIFATLAAHISKPTTELKFASDFELLIAVMLSAQASDVGVNKATKKLYPVANTPQAIFDLGETGLKTFIKTIGLYNDKAKNIIKTCQILMDEHGGIVPETRDALEALPGVGRKTANVVLNTAFGHPVIAVDTHIFRVSNRTKIAMGKTVLAVEKKLDKTTPHQYKKDAHHLLILHGRYTCIARKPRCGACVIADLCEFKDKVYE